MPATLGLPQTKSVPNSSKILRPDVQYFGDDGEAIGEVGEYLGDEGDIWAGAKNSYTISSVREQRQERKRRTC